MCLCVHAESMSALVLSWIVSAAPTRLHRAEEKQLQRLMSTDAAAPAVLKAASRQAASTLPITKRSGVADAGTSADRAGERGLVAAGHKAARKGLTSSNVYRQECDHGGRSRLVPNRNNCILTASAKVNYYLFLFSSRAFS